jgi:3-phosphoshikimate 1-carboxyvinyltransferase
LADSITIAPLGPGEVNARVRVPGSKSYTNRALMVAALARGHSKVTGALFSDDTRYMSAALNQLGARVSSDESATSFDVDGCDGQLTAAEAEIELFVGNAGTAARFLAASLALGQGSYRLDGVARMRERPMRDLFTALGLLGVAITEHGAPGCLPVTLSGRTRRAGDVRLPVPGNASSQFLSGLLLAAPYLGGEVVLEVVSELVSKPYLDLTTQVMASFGVNVEQRGYEMFRVPAGQRYQGRDYEVEPDASAASYFFAAAAICNGRVTVEGLGTNTRQGDFRLVDILERMGARVEREAQRTTVIGTGTLRGVDVDMSDLTDVAQTLAMVAPFAVGPTRITGIGFIRHKETDRVGNVVKELTKLGISATEQEDGYTIEPGRPHAGSVETYDDHRMAMSFALLGLKQPGIQIENPACTSKTFPHYFNVLDQLRG